MNRKKLLQLYFEAGIDEVISETAINRLSAKNLSFSKENFDKQNLTEQNFLKEVATSFKSTATTTEELNQNVKQESQTVMFNVNNKMTTNDAISKLAQRHFGSIISGSISQNNSSVNFLQNIEKTVNKPLLSIAEIVVQVKETVDSCQNLAELKKAVENFDGCSIKKMATNTVFGDGDPNSEIMVIGEAPGNQEDLQGIPFCGDSGKLLNEMFKAIGFKRENLYITNTLFWRPPGNRRPTEEELLMCKPFVEKHISLIKPKLIVLMGATAMADVLKIDEPISKMRGKFFDYQNHYLSEPIKSTILFHPSYLMRQSSKKREAWADLLMIKEFLEN